MMFNGILSGEYELLSSLSHIGESAGIDSFLNTQMIVNGDTIEEVFVYTGNAVRGALRDAAAKYLLNSSSELIKVSKDMFQLLFSGGNISGEQKNDMAKTLKLREDVPLVSVFGGGIGNAILSGKIDVSDGYPICKETKHILPDLYKNECSLSWKEKTSERSYSRMDDSKETKLMKYLIESDISESSEKKKEKEASTQMRYTVEVLNAGTKLYQMIQLEDLTQIELGCLVSAISIMAQTPYLGGKKNVGMGRYKLCYKYEGEVFFKVDKEGKIEHSKLASDALDVYTKHIKTVDIKGLELWKK